MVRIRREEAALPGGRHGTVTAGGRRCSSHPGNLCDAAGYRGVILCFQVHHAALQVFLDESFFTQKGKLWKSWSMEISWSLSDFLQAQHPWDSSRCSP